MRIRAVIFALLFFSNAVCLAETPVQVSASFPKQVVGVYPAPEENTFVISVPEPERGRGLMEVACYTRPGAYARDFNSGAPVEITPPSIMGAMGTGRVTVHTYEPGEGIWFAGHFERAVTRAEPPRIFVKAITETGTRLKWAGPNDFVLLPVPVESVAGTTVEVQKIQIDGEGRVWLGVVIKYPMAPGGGEEEPNSHFVKELQILRMKDGQLDKEFGDGTGVVHLRISGQPQGLTLDDLRWVEDKKTLYITGNYEIDKDRLPKRFIFSLAEGSSWKEPAMLPYLRNRYDQTSHWKFNTTGTTLRYVVNPGAEDDSYLYFYEEMDLRSGALIARTALNVGLTKDLGLANARERTHLVQFADGTLFSWWHYGSFIRYQLFDADGGDVVYQGYLYHRANASRMTPASFLERMFAGLQRQVVHRCAGPIFRESHGTYEYNF